MYSKSGARQGSRDLAVARENREKQAIRPGVLIVKWSAPPGAPRGARTLARLTADDPQRRHVEDRLRFLRDNHGLQEVVPIFGERRRAARHPAKFATTDTVARSMAGADDDETAGLTIVHVDPKTDVRALARELRGRGVEYAEPSPMRWLKGKGGATLDPRISKQWGLQAIDWYGAKRPSASNVGVAVVDSGIDRNHPDLKKAVGSYDDGGFGPTDRVGHGTHVAGIIAAVTNNRIGIAGVSNARLHCWKVFDANDDYDDVAYLRALGAVAGQASVRVLNLSLGGEDRSRAEQDLLARLHRGGTLVVAAMGNEYNEGNPVEYPAAYDTVMAVGAVGPDFERSSFSNVGRHISIVAPGEKILSTLPRKATRERRKTYYGAWDGTSMATPFVAGAAALVFARFPSYGPDQVRRKLEKSVVKPDTMRKPRDNEYGYGALNLSKALSARTTERRR